ncbi:hypothetical protein AC1031_002361 [Aphanomyces cochlioides]|nr:hypothetical protein AC1031_002361 [Aphanomyces cochlioides]
MLPPAKMPVQRRLPGEIIQRIALFIPECDTFFALLDAFAEEGIGVLHHYLDLRKLMSPSLLWPTLRFYKYVFPSSLVLHHIECLSACVSKVQLPPDFDVLAVCPYLAPTSMVINASSFKGGLEDQMRHQTLRLVSTRTHRGLRILLGALPLTNLTHLIVQGAMLADRGCLALAEVLPSLNLSYLDISDNHISDFGVNPLAQVLPSVVQLHELVMTHNFLGMRGIVALMEAWASPTLPPRILDLRQNSLEKENQSAVQPAFDRFSNPEYVIKVDYGKSGSRALLEQSPSGYA